MHDFAGKDLNPGDYVIFIAPGNKRLKFGQVEKITDKRIAIKPSGTKYVNYIPGEHVYKLNDAEAAFINLTKS